MFQSSSTTGPINKNTPHGFTSSGKKAFSILELRTIFIGNLEPRLMDQGRRLKSLAGRLLGHLARRQFPELSIDLAQKHVYSAFFTITYLV